MAAAPIYAQKNTEHLDSVISTLHLKEVLVKAKKVRQSGDTISFMASSYRTKNDKVLEDLLRKMPGIEITDNGQIKYNGQWVNEFYIEGSDMLGDNYGLATKNIDANAIGSVQIMENHQDIKLLQGLKKGNAPAMNIKLKSTAKGAWSAMLSAAVGSKPQMARDVTLSVMNFRRKSQNLSLYKTNDIGTELCSEINAPTTLNSALGTGILLPDKPSISDAYSYRNNSHSLSVNQLFKLDADRTLTMNANYLYDKEKQDAEDQNSYLMDDGSRYVMQESNHAHVAQNFVGGHVAYKLNSRKTYLKDNLSVSASFPNNQGVVNENVCQKLTGHYFLLSNALKANYKKKSGGVADLDWQLSFVDRKGLLHVADLGLSQRIGQRRFKSEATGSLVALTIPHLMFNLNGNVMVDWQHVAVLLNRQDDEAESRLNTWTLGAFVSPKLFLHWGNKLQWLVNVPIGMKYYRSEDEAEHDDKSFFSVAPYSNLTYRPSDHLSFDLMALCEEELPSALSLMAQKRYANYRTTLSNPNRVEMSPDRTWKLALTSSYKDVVKMLFGGITLSYVDGRTAHGTSYRVVDDEVDYTVLPQSTHHRVWQVDQTFSKGFFHWNSKVSESFSMGTSKNEYYVDERLHTGRSDYWRANVSYVASVAKWLSLSTSNDYSVQKPYADGKKTGVSYCTFKNATSLTFGVCKQLSIMPSVQYYHNNYYTTGRNNVFLNAGLEYYWRKTTWSLKCTNLLDNRTFHRVVDNGVTRYSSSYQLRGRTIMLGIRIKII